MCGSVRIVATAFCPTERAEAPSPTGIRTLAAAIEETGIALDSDPKTGRQT